MEKEIITFTNRRGLTLVADFYQATSHKGIICCHGFTGDRHEGGKYDVLAKQLQQQHYNVLTFDFAGSGESDDEALNTNKQAQDFQDAVTYMHNRGITQLGAVGMSLGPVAILKNKHLLENIIQELVLWCPVTYKKDNYALYKFTKEQIKELQETGRITHKKVRKGRPRHNFLIDKQVINEREHFNQETFLKGITQPLLIIHGDQDRAVPLEWSQKALQYLPQAQLYIIKGAGHTFERHEEEAIQKTVNWFKQRL